jgi:hypothetical protein
MKRPIIIAIALVLMSFQLPAQEDFSSSEPVIDEQNLSVEEGSLESELVIPQTDEVATPVEAERQEDVLFPEGEDTAWSLGSDEVASEDID